MSKLSQLKQDAYQSGKKRDWESAVSIYEQILELDKSNPSLVNELGDLCLKTGDTKKAIKHFLSAASKYRSNGLLNNAVAIYKKVLRHDDSNLNAHWYLAETRASQGLLVEGETHGVLFLEGSTNITGDIKEIFLKRCIQLFELYSNSTTIMQQLLQVFRMWDMQLEAGRVSCILACQIWDSGDEDGARESVQNVTALTPDIVKYPEHTRWLERISPPAGDAGAGFSDVNALNLDGVSETPEPFESEPVVEHIVEPVVEPVADSVIEQPIESVVAPVIESVFDQATDAKVTVDPFAVPESNADPVAASKDPVAIGDPFTAVTPDHIEPVASIDTDQDEEGCFSLDDDSEVSFDDLISAATMEESVPVEEPAPPFENQLDDLADGGTATVNSELNEKEEEVDLLAQILADDSATLAPAANNQVATITEEIGSKVGAAGEGEDGSLYEMGLVYLEMDMYDQACESFEKAAGCPDYAIRAHEMWGITLLRSGNIDQAVIILTAGLDLPEEGSRQQLGMLYHLGRAQEQAERFEEAEHCYKQIYAIDRSFLDVGKRLAELTTV